MEKKIQDGRVTASFSWLDKYGHERNLKLPYHKIMEFRLNEIPQGKVVKKLTTKLDDCIVDHKSRQEKSRENWIVDT